MTKQKSKLNKCLWVLQDTLGHGTVRNLENQSLQSFQTLALATTAQLKLTFESDIIGVKNRFPVFKAALCHHISTHTTFKGVWEYECSHSWYYAFHQEFNRFDIIFWGQIYFETIYRTVINYTTLFIDLVSWIIPNKNSKKPKNLTNANQGLL